MVLNRCISRRNFLSILAVGGGATLMGFPSWATDSSDTVHLSILHTNDTHSRIDPYPANDPNYPEMGGYARRGALINKIRSEVPNVLLLDAGDIFQGTPYYNVYGGEPELILMSKMGYDAATMGNHEFDNGLQGFYDVLHHAKFPFITSNYDFSQTPLHGKTIPWLVTGKGGLKIGIYGLGIELLGLVGRNLYQDTMYLDPIKVAQQTEKILKFDEDCDLVICLSHLGYTYDDDRVNDRIIARHTSHTHIILGGHTHTVLDPASQVQNAIGKTVYIGQTGYGGVRLGKMDIYYNKQKKDYFVESTTTKILEKQVG